MTTKLKHLVSKRKRRFVENGYDLDLTYIKPNIVAMGFPSEKLEGVFRNSMQQIVRFFDIRHGDHYKVYNLCSERAYDPGKFHQRVATYPFDDHNAPPFELIKPFCDDMDLWLKADDRNVAVVHCKAGKGRTGVMICAYLLHDKLFDNVRDALQFYGEARTQNAKGVTIPSQRRYVQYYGHLMRNNLDYAPKTVLLKALRLEGIPSVGSGNALAISFIVRLYRTKIYSSKLYENIRKTDAFAELTLPQPVPLCGDIKIEFFLNTRFGGKEKLFHFWFNTFFIDMHVMQQTAKYAEEHKKERDEKESRSKVKEDKGAHAPPRLSHRSRGQATGAAMAVVSRDKVAATRAHHIAANGGMASDYQIGPDCKVIILPKDELDKANKDKKHYSPNFQVHVVLSEVASEHLKCEVPDEDDSDNISVETDLSDTDPEDEWDSYKV